MTKDRSEISFHKRRLLQAIGTGVVLSASSQTALAGPDKGDGNDDQNDGGDLPGDGPGKGGRGRGEYPKVPKDEAPTVPISDLATQIAYHPNHDRAIFTTAAWGEMFELYVAHDVSGPESTSSEIWRLTETTEPVLAPEFLKHNRIRYNRDFTRYERKLPPSNKVYESKIIEEYSTRGVDSL